MPTTCGHTDSKGTYCQWGGHGAHYYYTPGDKESMDRARAKADAQGAAAHASGWQGKGDRDDILDEEDEENMEDEKCPECALKALPDVKPNEDEQTYVSRCIAFETEHSPNRPADQISRMCYEKYRTATGKKSEDSLEKAVALYNEIKADFEKIKSAKPKN